jgi:hypothetical protein
MKVFILSGILITLSSCFSYAQESSGDSVTISFEVVVPESTPDDATIFWAGSLNNWEPGDEGSGFSAKFLVRGYPTKYLIGPDGNVLETGGNLRGEKLIETLEKYLE